MLIRDPRRVLRVVVVSVVLVAGPTTACAVTGTVAVRLARTAPAGTSGPDQVMALGVAVALAVALAWLALAVASGCVDAVRHLGRAHPPAPVRRRGGVAALACTLVLAVAAAPAAAASPVPPPVPTGAPDAAATPGSTTTPPGSPPASPPTSAATAPDPPAPGWVPRVSRVPPATTALVTAPVTAPEPGPAPHVVVRGDTLWEIAAARLGPAATAAEIAAEWPRWWRANHAVVGDDPDLLRPGQVLHPPPPTR